MIENSLGKKIKDLNGPIIIFGAGGFIGINLLITLLKSRKDVFGASSNIKKNWRFKYSKVSNSNLLEGNINNTKDLTKIISKIKPKTIFNLAAYGAYSKQTDYRKIYETNYLSTVEIIENLKKNGFNVYIHAGSQSEYGSNSSGPKEDGELIPNSHYAVSKVGDYFLLKYYGKVEKLPVFHLRLYSAYGPWEEPDRLMPVLLQNARNNKLPPFVNPNISRDFVYVNDIVEAFILAASKINKKNYGEAFNIASARKTTIKKLAFLVKKILKIKEKPVFGAMKNRNWDLAQWYGDNKKAKRILGWTPKTTLENGLKLTIAWQEEINYDSILKTIVK